MKKIAVLLVFLVQTTFAAGQWSIGYWSPWGSPGCPVSDIDMSALTHIIHWAAVVRADGTLDLNQQNISSDAPALVSTAHASGVRVLLGLIQQSQSLSQAAANNRAALVNSIMNVVNSYGYDGVDIDWEPINSGSDGGPMRALAADLRSQGARILTAAAIGTDARYWGSVQDAFDRVNAMTYDMTGLWNAYSWHNSALYDPDGSVWSINLAVQRFTSAGVPASKLGIGIPFYGWQWNGGGITGPRQYWSSTPNLQQINYQNLVTRIPQQSY